MSSDNTRPENVELERAQAPQGAVFDQEAHFDRVDSAAEDRVATTADEPVPAQSAPVKSKVDELADATPAKVAPAENEMRDSGIVADEPETPAPGDEEKAHESDGPVTAESSPGSSAGAPAESSTSVSKKKKFTSGTLVAGVLAAGLGFAMMTQAQQTERSGLNALSQGDLIALLSNVNDQSARLDTELDDLRSQKTRLSSGNDSQAVADAQKRLDQLAILNGTAAVSGPGITIEVSGAKDVTAANVLDAVEELRDAGAESIDVGGHRVVLSTWFSDADGHVTVDGEPLDQDFTISAIGDAHTMGTAMAIPGGVTDTLTQAGAHVKVTEKTEIRITSVQPKK